MSTIYLKRGDKYKVDIDNPRMIITGLNVIIDGKHDHYDINPIHFLPWYGGMVEKNALCRITIEEEKDYKLFFAVSYGKFDKDDPNKYIYINESLSKGSINDPECPTFIDADKEFDNHILESLEILINNQEE